MARKSLIKYSLYAVIAFLLFIVLTNLAVHLKSSSYIYEDTKDVENIETALILGAAVYSDGDLTPVYQHRVDKAIELYRADKVSKILASGDNSTVEHNEVNPVRDYLLAEGIPDVDIYLDHAGFDTYSTMYRARDVFKVSSVVIVTQSFHLPRAVFIARALGIEAYGVPANDGRVTAFNYFREVFANEKAVFNIIFNREPKYLGEAIPIGEERVLPPMPDITIDDEKEENISNGYIAGNVEIGPNCPVETVENPCETPPEAYSSREVVIYKTDGKTIVKKGKIDSNGNFNISLPAGNYLVQVVPGGMGPSPKQPVKVESKKTTNIELYVDTGIR